MNQARPWLQSYPAGVAAEIDLEQFRTVAEVFATSVKRFADRPAYHSFGKTITYRQADQLVEQFAAYLLGELQLKKGDRVALMMPNCLQYPVATFGILRAGLTVVNVNPLYTPRELEHQLKDSGAKAIFIVENFAHTLEQCIAATPVQHIVLCAMGDPLGFVKGAIVNYVVRSVKKLVPAFRLPGAVRFKDALSRGARGRFTAPEIGPDDVALLQYTGGTTGISKGAVLLHRNVIANVLQSEAWNDPAMQKVPKGEQTTVICALPLYHIFAFTVNMMLGMRIGAKTVLIPN
ncbi:MAG: long-chain fatty acid--CoA ligase, partial [Oxalobacteraceae bacterium]